LATAEGVKEKNNKPKIKINKEEEPLPPINQFIKVDWNPT